MVPEESIKPGILAQLQAGIGAVYCSVCRDPFERGERIWESADHQTRVHSRCFAAAFVQQARVHLRVGIFGVERW